MKVKIFLLLFLISNSGIFGQVFEQGYSLSAKGKKKDKSDGKFKDFDIVRKQNPNLYVVKTKTVMDEETHTLKSWLVNSKGDKITNNTYTDIGDFSEGLAEFTVGNLDFCRSCFDSNKYNYVALLGNNCGFINEMGQVVIKPKYRIVKGNFSNGLCLVGFYNSHLFYINKAGHQQFRMEFSEGEPFRGSIAGVTYRNGSKNFINTAGKNLIPNYYKYIQPFNVDYIGMIRAYKTLDNKIGFWTSNCKDLHEPIFEYFNYSILRKKILVKKNNKYGYIDFFSGKEIIPIQYDSFKIDKNINYTLLSKNHTWYRLDTLNSVVKLAKAIDIKSLGMGLYKYLINDSWGVIDSLGNIKCNPKLSEISDKFINGYLPVKLKNKYGYLNKSGELLIEAEYDKLGELRNNKFICDKGFYQYTINIKGKIINKNVQPIILLKSVLGTIFLVFTLFIYLLFIKK